MESWGNHKDPGDIKKKFNSTLKGKGCGPSCYKMEPHFKIHLCFLHQYIPKNVSVTSCLKTTDNTWVQPDHSHGAWPLNPKMNWVLEPTAYVYAVAEITILPMGTTGQLPRGSEAITEQQTSAIHLSIVACHTLQ